eukprot:g19565.t1
MQQGRDRSPRRNEGLLATGAGGGNRDSISTTTNNRAYVIATDATVKWHMPEARKFSLNSNASARAEELASNTANDSALRTKMANDCQMENHGHYSNPDRGSRVICVNGILRTMLAALLAWLMTTSEVTAEQWKRFAARAVVLTRKVTSGWKSAYAEIEKLDALPNVWSASDNAKGFLSGLLLTFFQSLAHACKSLEDAKYLFNSYPVLQARSTVLSWLCDLLGNGIALTLFQELDRMSREGTMAQKTVLASFDAARAASYTMASAKFVAKLMLHFLKSATIAVYNPTNGPAPTMRALVSAVIDWAIYLGYSPILFVYRINAPQFAQYRTRLDALMSGLSSGLKPLVTTLEEVAAAAMSGAMFGTSRMLEHFPKRTMIEIDVSRYVPDILLLSLRPNQYSVGKRKEERPIINLFVEKSYKWLLESMFDGMKTVCAWVATAAHARTAELEAAYTKAASMVHFFLQLAATPTAMTTFIPSVEQQPMWDLICVYLCGAGMFYCVQECLRIGHDKAQLLAERARWHGKIFRDFHCSLNTILARAHATKHFGRGSSASCSANQSVSGKQDPMAIETIQLASLVLDMCSHAYLFLIGPEHGPNPGDRPEGQGLEEREGLEVPRLFKYLDTKYYLSLCERVGGQAYRAEELEELEKEQGSGGNQMSNAEQRDLDALAQDDVIQPAAGGVAQQVIYDEDDLDAFFNAPLDNAAAAAVLGAMDVEQGGGGGGMDEDIFHGEHFPGDMDGDGVFRR